MNFPIELIDLIIYFTTNKVIELSQVSKYFNHNVKRIRINDNKKYPLITDKHLIKIPNIHSLYLDSHIITNDGLSKLDNLDNLKALYSVNIMIADKTILRLTNLTTLQLHRNNTIRDEHISCLTNLTSLRLRYSHNRITYKGISNLSKLVELDLYQNCSIRNEQLSKLTRLTSLNLSRNTIITNEGISSLTNLIKLNLAWNSKITPEGISKLTNITSLDISNNQHFHKFTT